MIDQKSQDEITAAFAGIPGGDLFPGFIQNLLFFSWLLLLVSCIGSCTKPYIYLTSTPYDLKSLTNKSITVVGTDGLLVKGFSKTFNEKYKNSSIFRNTYVIQFKNQLIQGRQFNQVLADTSHSWNLLKSFAGSKDDFNTIDSLYGNINSDYVMNIHHFEISNRFSYTTGSASGNTTNIRTEVCVVKARLQVIDRISRKPVIEFESNGEKALSLFNYSATLEKAMLNSIDHAVRFLQSGETKFKK